MARKPRIVTELEIVDVAEKGKGVGKRPDGRVVFVQNVVPGDIVDVRIRKSRKSFQEGFPIHWHKYSERRVTPKCMHFQHCGGCQWQHLSYADQLYFKENMVRNAMLRIGKIGINEFLPILGAPDQYYYRNKLEFGFSNKKWLAPELLKTDVSAKEDSCGFHVSGAYDKILDIQECHLQAEPSNAIRLGVKAIAIEQGLPFFDSRAEEGFLRQFMIRLTSTEDIMLLFSFYYNDRDKIKKYLDAVGQAFPEINSIHYCINGKKNDFMFDLDMNHFSGTKTITEKLGDVSFNIGPKSFFQTNTKQGKNLFDVVVDFANLQGTENVYDLYTGIGSIALYIANRCRQVVGIEEIEAAVEDAKMNALDNDITNTIFYAGDVKDMLNPAFKEKHGQADVLITDPPRAGMHPKVIDLLLDLEVPKVIYVSCNPGTQARDLQFLAEKYTIEKMRPVDMFPNTSHIENVALLQLKK